MRVGGEIHGNGWNDAVPDQSSKKKRSIALNKSRGAYEKK